MPHAVGDDPRWLDFEGRFDEFMPVRLSIDDIVRMSIALRDAEAARPQDRKAVVVRAGKTMAMVRYRLGSQDIRTDIADMGADTPFATGIDAPRMTTVLGLVDLASGRAVALAVLHVRDGDEPSGIIDLVTSRDLPPTQEDLLGFLREIDLPASWRAGLDHGLSDRHDVRYDPEAGWIAEEPRYLVAVTLERSCFSVRPTISESIDVLLPVHPDNPLSDADADTIYWAKSFYRDHAFGRLHEMTGVGEVRAGFSSWGPKGDPRIVKVVGRGLEDELRFLSTWYDAPDEDETEEAAPSPGR